MYPNAQIAEARAVDFVDSLSLLISMPFGQGLLQGPCRAIFVGESRAVHFVGRNDQSSTLPVDYLLIKFSASGEVPLARFASRVPAARRRELRNLLLNRTELNATERRTEQGRRNILLHRHFLRKMIDVPSRAAGHPA